MSVEHLSAWFAVPGKRNRGFVVLRTGAVVFYAYSPKALGHLQYDTTCCLGRDTQINRCGSVQINLEWRGGERRMMFRSREETTTWLIELQKRCPLPSLEKERMRQKNRIGQMKEGGICLKTTGESAHLVKLWLSPCASKLLWQAKQLPHKRTKTVNLAQISKIRLVISAGSPAIQLVLGTRTKDFILPDTNIVPWFLGLQQLGPFSDPQMSESQCIVRKAVLRLRKDCGKCDFAGYLLENLFGKRGKRPDVPRLSLGKVSMECSTDRSSNAYDMQLSDCEVEDEEESIPLPLVSPTTRSLNLKSSFSEQNRPPLTSSRSAKSIRLPESPGTAQLCELISTLMTENRAQKQALNRLLNAHHQIRTQLQASILKQKAQNLRQTVSNLRKEVLTQYQEFAQVWPHVMQLTTQHMSACSSRAKS